MKTKLTAIVTAAAIATSSINVAPAAAMTDEEKMLLLFGIAALAIAASSGGAAPAPVPAPTPVTYSTGPIKLKQTYTADFDNGNVGGPGADLWFQAATPSKRFLTPRNGAKLAVGDKSNRGYAGCSVASYSSQKVRLFKVPVGSYVCMKTSAGRISQFRVNAVNGGAVKTLKLGYTTWQ